MTNLESRIQSRY